MIKVEFKNLCPPVCAWWSGEIRLKAETKLSERLNGGVQVSNITEEELLAPEVRPSSLGWRWSSDGHTAGAASQSSDRISSPAWGAREGTPASEGNWHSRRL